MNDDEAFIRAIVDAPGDDLPRLVYADWLDDRADRRGPYLRAEREAVATGDIARLHDLSLGLDPVWAARVSRPPAGVCVGIDKLSDPGPLVTTDDIATAERFLDVEFPTDYRAFLLNYNGGYLATNETVSAPRSLFKFYPMIRKPKQGTFSDLCSNYRHYRADYLGRHFRPDEDLWHRNYMPVADMYGASELCIGIVPPVFGRVYSLVHRSDYNPHNATEIASTFASFLATELHPTTVTHS